MKEYYHKMGHILGIDIALLRPDKAASLTMEMTREEGFHDVFILSAADSLFCQNHENAEKYVNDCNLVLAGDSHIETALVEEDSAGNRPGRIGKFARDYTDRLFQRMNRAHKSVFLVMQKEEQLTEVREYLRDHYPGIRAAGDVYTKDRSGEVDRIINEINGMIPDAVFFALEAEDHIGMLGEYKNMMNTRLCVWFEFLPLLVRTETEHVPAFFEMFGLQGLYRWLTREGKIRSHMIASLFRRRLQDEEGQSSDENQDGM